MTDRILSSLTFAITAVAAQCLPSLTIAQDYPPAPPYSVRLQQLAQAPDPTLTGPILPGPNIADRVAPRPEDLPPADPNQAVPDADVEAFARGPVHEAFADVYDLNPVTNEVIAQAPPAVVEELPPEQAPTGENVQWISGYWSWDSEAANYMWVSGVWRDVPPGRRWVPGYWADVTGGFQWVGGFWADAQVQELTYVPTPPLSLEAGPNLPPPGDDQQWVPGNWTYVSNNYRWSPGYYMPCQSDFMWVPNQYSYTPNGCVFVPGYRDYRFARRGTLFSPVRFRRPLLAYGYSRPACYRPRFSVNMASFMIHLFVRPRCRNFYYGDYYGNQYAGLGFSPWYQRSFANHRGYDPALSFYRWDSHRHGVDFDRSVATWHQRYESNSSIRPPRMIQDQAQFLARHHGDRAAELAVMGHRFDDAVKSPRAGESFHRMNRHDIDLQRENSQVNHSLESARRQLERESHGSRSGHHQPENVVNLRQKDHRGPAGGKADSNRVNDSPAHKEKLVLTDLPARLKERTHDSAAPVERVRHHAGSNDQLAPALVEHRAKSVVNDRVGHRADLTNPSGVSGNPDAANRLSENRQNAVERRQTRDIGNSHERAAPTPDAIHHRTPHTNHRVPQNEGAVHERAVRDRAITPHIDNSAPVMRHQPVEHAPRQIERHVPVEHAPRHIERAPAQQHAPTQHHAPVQHHAPRSEGQHPHHKGHS